MKFKHTLAADGKLKEKILRNSYNLCGMWVHNSMTGNKQNEKNHSQKNKTKKSLTVFW